MDMDEIEGSHCRFSVRDDFKVRVEFFSSALIMSFAIVVDFAHGFKTAKTSGVELVPIVSNGIMISNEAMQKFVKGAPSGWSFLRILVETLDRYVRESENIKFSQN
jgi:hypothetical protein